MRKSLLTASSNLVSLKKRISLHLLVFGLLFGFGLTQTTTAQNCIGPYKAFESFKNSTPTGFVYGSATPFTNATTGSPRTGRYHLQHIGTNSDATVTTPNVTNVSTFSFWIKKTGTNAVTFGLEFSPDNGANFYAIPSGSNTIATYNITATYPTIPVSPSMTTFVKASVAFDSATPIANCIFRISDVRATVAGGLFLDDFAWTSTVSAENNIVVPELGATTACSSITVPSAISGNSLTFYDQGGSSDTYSLSQNQTWTFTPAIASEKVKITFQNSFNLDASANITVYNGVVSVPTIMLNAYTSTSTLPSTTVYTSTDANGAIVVRFVSAAGTPPFPGGFDIKVECVGCPAPSSLALAAGGGISHDSAYLTWSGASSSYDIFYATVASGTVPVNGAAGNGGSSATTTATVTGLTAGTAYNFWVRGDCGSGSLSTWHGPISGTTLCTPQTVTYLENFNGWGGALPTCTKATDPAWVTNTTNGNLYTNAVGTSFFTQGVTLTAGQLYRVTYDYQSNGNGSASMDVEWGHPTNNVDATVSNIGTALASHALFTGIETNIVNFTAATSGTHYLEFKLTALETPGTGALNIDNVKIEVETCLPPSFAAASPVAPAVSGSPEVTSLTDFGANVTWLTPATGDPSNGYYYFVSTTSTRPSYNATASGSTGFMQNSVTLGTLSPNTRYYIWVRANCGAQVSVWSANYVTFVTTNITAPTFIKISDTHPVLLPTPRYEVTCGQNIVFTDSNFYTTTGTTSGVTHAAGDYTNYEQTSTTPYTYTFVPTTAGAKLRVVFNSFRTEDRYDGLLIYSGTSAAGTLMSSGRAVGTNAATCPAGAFSGTGSPGTIVSTAADGSLTFVFRSDVSLVFAGWTASINCITNPPTITSFTPTTNTCGAPTNVVITGTNFSSVTNVSFGGVSASYTVNSTTQITASVPAGAYTSTISVTTTQATATSATVFTVQAAAPTTTPATVCLNGSGTLTSSTACDLANITTFNGALTGSSPQAPKPSSSGNTCGFSAASNFYYTVTQFTVSVSGSYTFQTTSPGNIDLMAYITSGSFTAGSCATGTFILADDDAAGSLQPRLVVNLTAGILYTLYTTTYNANITTTYTWNITPPVGGSIALYQAGQVEWYTAASGGTPIYTGSPFNPVGISGSGLTDTATPGTTVYYAACGSNATCRTATNFVISPATPGTASSNQSVCTGSAAPLTLVGNAGVVTRWQYCPNAAFLPVGTIVDIPSSASNTLTSLQIGSFAGTRYFRAQVTVGSCVVYSNVITITFNKVIWDGAGWFDALGNPTSAPTSTVGVEFQGDFTSSVNAGPSGDISACSVTVTGGADVLFDIGTLTVQNDVNVSSGFLTIEDDASLYQVQDVANAALVYSGGNSGSITSRRTAEPMYKFDYTYWSSPVNPQNLLAVSPASPLGWFLTYNATTNAWQYVTSPSTTTMEVGRGYLIRAPLNYPISPSLPWDYTASFSGVPNNGTFTTPIVGGAAQMNLIGNPYPSALSAFPISAAPGDAGTGFITANPNVNGTLYFWTHNTPLNPVTLQYFQDDYAIYNLVGGTLPAPTVGAGTSDLSAPSGYIASGQGFFVKGLTSGTATFSNAMRRAGNNTQFYKSDTQHTNDTSLEKHRYWVNIANSEGAFKQILVGYIETATSGLDRLFDGEMVDVGNVITLYTTVENTSLSIQGRPLPFDVADTVPLGYKSTINGTFTISLSHYDGLFTTQHVYLEDKLLDVIHDLRVSPYSFATLIGTFNDRFELRYTNTALGTTNPVFNENSVIVYKNDQGLYIDSGAVNMATVSIFDIRGRLLATQKQVDRTTTVFTTLPTTNQVLLVRIEADNGAIVTKKVVY